MNLYHCSLGAIRRFLLIIQEVVDVECLISNKPFSFGADQDPVGWNFLTVRGTGSAVSTCKPRESQSNSQTPVHL